MKKCSITEQIFLACMSKEKPSRQNVPWAIPPPTLKLGVSYKDGAHYSEPASCGQLCKEETP